ncbi:MAG: ABC transporter ATP-binding protein [Oscillibacter sp.]|jgi:peptide/nickel transport system ATP-binding protein|nr:ABC transporter ATP-binding protein [Oscillibacter sp.]
MDDVLLDIKNLSICYSTEDGEVHALNNADLTLHRGESLGLVGETGAGKTTLARGVMRLIPNPPGKVVGGEIFYDGRDLLKLSEADMRRIRGREISMIFQDPMTSLNPVMTVGDQILEVINVHHPDLPRHEARKKAEEMMEMVGITSSRYEDYPHQFSGGMKQRVVIAIALACSPKMLIADEPTTALDVTIQAQVLEMIRDLKEKNNTSMLLITHDLGVVAQNCDRVAIIYSGEIVEYGTLHQIYKETLHPYTEGLFGSIPNLTSNIKRLAAIDGMMPDPTALPAGCKFADRCKYATDRCRTEHPRLLEREDGHKVRCIRYESSGEVTENG